MKTGDQIVQDLPWKWPVQGKIFIIGGLGYMFDAWDVSINGFLTPLLAKQFDLSSGERGLVASSNLIGMAIGAVVWGTIADRMGRKKAFSLTLLIFALFSVLGAVAPNYEVFLLLRFVAGFGLGGCIPVDYALVSEFSPRKVRGKVLTAMDLWWPIGAASCGVASTILLPFDHNWRWMLAVMILPALLLFWVRRGIPESPLYLARKGQEAAAREVIDSLVRRTGAVVEPYTIERSIPSEKVKMGLLAGVSATVDQLRLIWRFSPRITSVTWALSIAVMTVYYSALSWMPSILTAQGYDASASFMGTTLMSVTGIVGVIFSVVIVEIFGRKWVIGIAATVSSAALVIFALVLDFQVAAAVMIGIFGFFILVTIPVLYAYISELYPTELRASGFGWASSVSRSVTGFTPLIFVNFLWPALGLPLTFTLLGVLVLAAVIWMAVAAPETKGRALDHIIEDDATQALPEKVL
jgi:MFS transporter, putative metabolite:H+ symporter